MKGVAMSAIRLSGRSVRSLSVSAAVILAAASLIGAGCQPVGTGGPSAPNYPAGVLESVVGGKGTVRITGWAADNWIGPGPEAGPRVPATIVVVVNGKWVAQSFRADQPRPDIGAGFGRSPLLAGYRQSGDTYGFDVTLPAPPGETTVCVGAVNSAYPELLMSWEEAEARGLHPSARADHSFIGCGKTVVK